MTGRKKICIVATVPVVLNVFMRAHILSLSKYYDVTLITSGSPHDVSRLLSPTVRFVYLNIERRIAIGKDIFTLFFLFKHFKTVKYDCVFSLMPKSGLIGMLAGFIARTPVRVHIFTGQVWSTQTGLYRLFLLSLDKLLASCATHLLADSESQKVFLEVNKVAKKGKIRVLGNGSISGVDSNRFSANPSVRFRIRQELGLKDNDVVFLFLGRVARAKGVVDLAYAFSKLAKQFDNAYLFVVGPDDDGLDQELDSILLTAGGRHHREGFTDTPEEWMAASDIFCLPSYREGFGMAVVEAASVGIPAIVSRTYGLIDAVDEDKTGIFHAPGDREEIYRCMKKLFEDPVTRAQLAGQARQRAVMSFSEKYVTDEMTCYIESILE